MTKNVYAATWFLFTTVLSIFNICTIMIFDGYNWPFYAVMSNGVFSFAGLIFYMHMNRAAMKHIAVKALRLLLFINSAAVFLMLGLSLFILMSQYHNRLTSDQTLTSAAEVREAMSDSDKDVTLLETDNLYIFCVNYNDISFVAGEERPSRDDKSIQMCVAAAFQHKYQLEFREDNIVGLHARDGHLEQGALQEGLGAFTYVNGTARIWNVDEAAAAVENAAAQGGSGYQQFIVLYDGQRGSHDSDEFRCYRVLAILNDRACIIDSRTQMHYGEFISALEDLGVRDALYCDMGSGWNYSWYRNAEGRPVDIIGMPWFFSHNWLIFTK